MVLRSAYYSVRSFVSPRLLLALGISLCLLTFTSCGGSTGPDEPPIGGIVQTLENGTIVEDDSLDWQPRLVESSGGGGGHVVVTDNSFSFAPAHPNPATSSTRFRCALADKSTVSIWIVNGRGTMVATLDAGSVRSAGIYEYEWKVRDDAGNLLFAPGVYRVYFKIIHGVNSTEVRSFGDVEVK